jgi:hypothetical protein
MRRPTRSVFHLHPNYRTRLSCPSRPTCAGEHTVHLIRQVVLLPGLPRVWREVFSTFPPPRVSYFSRAYLLACSQPTFTVS